MGNEKSNKVTVERRTMKMVSTLIIDYPELGYKTIEEFVDCAILDLLKRKGLEIGQLQTWTKRTPQT